MPKQNTNKGIANTYPYQNLDLADLRGEQWTDIPGLGGYFMVSNFGRIKRLEYETQYRNGAIHKKPEKIIKLGITKALNRYKKDYTHFLVVKVVLNGTGYSFSIARLVYSTFIEAIDSHSHQWVVLCRDGDNFNILPSNLVLATWSDKQRRTIERKRFRSPFLDFSEEFKALQYKRVGERTSKQVTQYDFSGKKIRTFPSMKAAQDSTGIYAGTIARSSSGKGVTAGGFIWRRGKASRVDMKVYCEGKRKEHRSKFGQRVTQYDLTGKRVACYPSLQDVEDKLGIRGSSISRTLNGQYKSFKGYIWRKGYGKPSIDLSDYKWGIASMIASRTKKVKQYTLQGKYIQTFASIKSAAMFIGVQASTLYGVCNSKQKTCRGFLWRSV